MRSRMCKCGLPWQEKRNCWSEFERYPGHGRFHVHAGRNESHPAVGTAALMDRTRTTLYVPWAREITKDMEEEGLEQSRRQKKGRKNFWRALAWRKLVFRLVDLVNQSKEKDCEDLCILPMMCIGGSMVVWFSCGVSFLRSSTRKVCAE